LLFVEVVSVEQYSFSLFLVAGNCRERNKKSKAHRKLTGDGELGVRRGCQCGAIQLFAISGCRELPRKKQEKQGAPEADRRWRTCCSSRLSAWSNTAFRRLFRGKKEEQALFRLLHTFHYTGRIIPQLLPFCNRKIHFF